MLNIKICCSQEMNTLELFTMIDYSQFPRKNILCFDMESFYASVSAVTMKLKSNELLIMP